MEMIISNRNGQRRNFLSKLRIMIIIFVFLALPLTVILSTDDASAAITTITIKVEDKKKDILLNDKLEFISNWIEVDVKWIRFERVEINLVEVRYDMAKDNQGRKKLIEKDSNILAHLEYSFNNSTNKFQKL